MLKTHKTKIIISTLIILIPILVGLLLWNQLPDQVATHWGADGQPNGWSSKLFAVVGLPLFLVAVHWICVLATAADHPASPTERTCSYRFFEIYINKKRPQCTLNNNCTVDFFYCTSFISSITGCILLPQVPPASHVPSLLESSEILIQLAHELLRDLSRERHDCDVAQTLRDMAEQSRAALQGPRGDVFHDVVSGVHAEAVAV